MRKKLGSGVYTVQENLGSGVYTVREKLGSGAWEQADKWSLEMRLRVPACMNE